jgi:DNA-binding NtrC family response regulator
MSEKNQRILIIDDNTSILRTMTHVLSKAGYAVEAVQTGNEATKKFRTKSFDAALIDIRLGDLEGTDLLPEIRKIAPNILTIMFTGTPMSEETLEKAKKGADVFLLKPVKPETLLEILKEKFT